MGEKGFSPSEGQRQRITIARALAKDPDILILDEPTAALDCETEKSIFKELSNRLHDKTLFIASHRLSAVENASRVVLLSEQQVLTAGTHQSLLAANNYYRTLSA